MNTILERISMRNFKGVSALDLKFTLENYLYGPNASGKTTVVDAFTWLLFGKDSKGRSDFQIRPVDENGRTVDGVDIEVEATLRAEFDGGAACDITFKKIQKQNWVKKRGSEAPTFQGNTYSYMINDFPATQKEFDAKVASIIDEKLFKLLTDPRAFASMKWQDQRAMLLRFVPNLTDQTILDGVNKQDYELIAKEILEAGVDKCREKATKDMKLLNKRLDEYPTRIDEAARAIRQTERTREQAELAKMATENQLKQLLAERDSAKGLTSEYEAISNQILQLIRKKDSIRADATKELNEKRAEARTALDDANKTLMDNKLSIARHESILRMRETELVNSEAELKAITDKWRETKKTELPEEDTICPTCGRPFEEDKLTEIRQNFDAKKEDRLNALQEQGVELRRKVNQIKSNIQTEKDSIESLTAETATLETAVATLKKRYDALPLTVDMSVNEAYQACETEIQKLVAKQEAMKTDTGAQDAFLEREKTLRSELDAINAELTIIAANADLKARIAELQEEQIDVGQDIANLERKLFLFEQFGKEKMSALSEQINSMFEAVRFRLFDVQINGGVKENCVMQVNSNGSYVDYASANSAAQIQGGLDVIRALSKLYDVTCPLFIDNRESCTEIPQMAAQIVNLIVSPADKVLRIENR